METLAEESQGEVVLEEEENAEAGSEDEGVEIVLSGEEDAASQTSVPKGFTKRINKLNQRNEQTSAELERAHQENELLKLQIQQQGSQAKKRPRLEDFDYDDDKYQEALDSFEAERLAQFEQNIVSKVASQVKPAEKEDTSALETHYERAEQLPVADYEAAEDRVIDAFGQGLFKEAVAGLTQYAQLRGRAAKTEQLMYFLGNPNNAKELEQLSDLFQQNPAAGTLALGELQGRLSLRPKSKPTPTAESEVSGDSGPASGSDWHKRIQKMRDSGKYTTKQIITAKKEARAAGVDI